MSIFRHLLFRTFSFTIAALVLLMVAVSCKQESKLSPPLVITQLDPVEAAKIAQEIRADIPAVVGEGLELSLWASDSLVADPISLHVDFQGRVYITRTNRQKNSEFDIRGHRDWMTESISFETVEDRRAFLKKTFATERSDSNTWLADLNKDSIHDWRDLAVEKEQVFRIEDQSGNGFADHSLLVIEDFNEEITDVAGTILTHNGELFLCVGPDLWRMKDTNGDGTVDEKNSISHGYNVHIGFGGHGMSGLIMGPDEKVYWSVGDIGFNVKDPTGKQWVYPNQGAILRANPDGSDFEVFAAGLRNPHEFVFDEYGNLFSVDNDGDHPGEKERLVYIVNGSDSGWRTNWQFGKYTDPDNNLYKVWMDEKLFKPRFEGQAAYITPPLMNYHSGPTGMVYQPGTAWGDKWANRFFIAEFTGSPARSHIYAFKVQPQGASFEFVEEEAVLGGILATGIDFGPDGAMYLADWIDGWGTKDYGRIWKLDVAEKDRSPLRNETQKLLGGNFDALTGEKLLELLHYPDMRVRLQSQYALARKGKTSASIFQQAMGQTEHQLGRVHGIWGLAQLARKDADLAKPLEALLTDSDEEIRAQAARWLGDIRYQPAGNAMLPLLKDESPRVRFFAAEALGRIEHKPAVQPIIDLLRANDDEDAYLRHAGALALSRIGEVAPLIELANDPSRALRIAAVVALRRLKDPGIAVFLKDSDEYIVTETARAINDDRSIPAALPALAQVLKEERFTEEALIRRAINANLRVGKSENLQLLADYSIRNDVSDTLRAEAISTLAVWHKPSVLDRVDGRNRGVVERDPALAVSVLEPLLPQLLAQKKTLVVLATTDAIGRLKIESSSSALHQLIAESRSAEIRSSALEALAKLDYDEMDDVIGSALKDRDKGVRTAALGLIPNLELPASQKVDFLASVIGKQSQEEQQMALTTLGGMSSPESHTALSLMLQKYMAGNLDPAIQLDLVEAIETSEDESLVTQLKTYQDQQPKSDELAGYREALVGGNPRAGGQIFYRNQSAQCVRCHLVGDYGGDVGPDLTTIGAKYNAEELLLSLINPSATIANGYGTVMLTLKDGSEISGTVRKETKTILTLQTSDAEPIKIPQPDITKRVNGPSSMPPMGAVLNKRELRDVVAFLSTRTGESN